jgi:hypothetical protein
MPQVCDVLTGAEVDAEVDTEGEIEATVKVVARSYMSVGAVVAAGAELQRSHSSMQSLM